MSPAETSAVLRQFNKWLRGNKDGPQLESREINQAINAAIEMLDRLEAAEADALEQARLNGMGAEREAALLAKLEAAEKSDAESLAMYRRARDERDALKDKIERMEQQRPFAWIVRGGYPVPLENLEWQLLCGAERPTLSWTNQEMRPLYALPGAKGEEK